MHTKFHLPLSVGLIIILHLHVHFHLYKCTPNSTFHCEYESLESLPKTSKLFNIGHPLPQFCSVNLTEDEEPK